MVFQTRLSPLKSHAYGLLPGFVNNPKKVDEKSTTNNSHFQLRITYKTGDADHSVAKNLGSASEEAVESEKRQEKVSEPEPAPAVALAEAEETGKTTMLRRSLRALSDEAITAKRISEAVKTGKATMLSRRALRALSEEAITAKRISQAVKTLETKQRTASLKKFIRVLEAQDKPAAVTPGAGVPAAGAPAAESTAANQRTISLIAALALTIFVIANRKKMPNKGSMLNFLNRNLVIKG